jgi:hypothetical protein
LDISPHQDGWWLSWWPDLGGSRYTSATSYQTALGIIGGWLARVRADHEAPDLWGEIKKGTAIPEAAQRTEYEKQFSAAELKQLEAALADIERYIATTQPLDPSGKQEVHKHFEYLLDAAKKGARKIDWLNVFVAQMVAMVVAGLLDPKVYGPVMAHAAQALNAIFQLGLKLLQ